MTPCFWLSRLLTMWVRALSVSGASHAGVDIAELGPPIPLIVYLGRPWRSIDRDLRRLLAAEEAAARNR